MKKTLAMILALVLILSLFAGCGETKTETTETKQETTETKKEETSAEPSGDWDGNVSGLNGKKTKVTAGLSSNVPTLTPAYKINTYSNVINSEIFEHLGQYEKVGSTEFIGVLMKSWNQVDDVTYEIEIYDYIYDSAGNHLTANDVKFSLDTSKEAGVSAAKNIKEVAVTGDYTCTITLANGLVGIFEEACQQLWIFTQAAWEASPDEMATDPVGTGPYVLTEYISGSYAEMEKRDDYWQKPELTPQCSKANIDVIRTEFITEKTQMAIAVETGSVQVGFYLSESIAIDLQEIDGRIYREDPNITNRITIFNCSENSILGGENGKLLRQAILYALDENAVVELALGGIGQPAKTYGMDGTVGYNKAWEDDGYYNYDPEKAKELMAEAGYPDGFKIRFMCVDDGLNKAYSQAVQTLLAAVGIEVELNWVTSAILTQTQNDLTAWDMHSCGYSAGNNYQAAMYNFIGNNTLRGTGYSFCGLQDDEFQTLVEKANSMDWTQADVDALHDEIVENAYSYKHFEGMYCSSRVEEMTDIYQNWRQDMQLGSCSYSEDWPYFA